jgi:hypothetical protein
MKNNNLFRTIGSYILTKNLSKLWHFYVFILITSTWLELVLMLKYRPQLLNTDLLLVLLLGLLPIYAFSIYCIKYHAITKKRPYWIVPFLLILIFMQLTDNPNPIKYPEAHPFINFIADNIVVLIFVVPLRIMLIIRNKK